MGHVLILLHVIALAAGIWSAFSLQARAGTLSPKLRKPYFAFILFFLLVVFFRTSSRYILVNLWGRPFVENPFFVVLITPLRAIAEAGMAFHFLRALWSLRNGEIPKPLRKILEMSLAAFALAYGYALVEFLRTSMGGGLMALNKTFDAAILAAVLIPSAAASFQRGGKAPNAGPNGRLFAVLYSAGFGLLPAAVLFSDPARSLIIAFCYLNLSLIPVVWLPFASPSYRLEVDPPPAREEDGARLSRVFGFTDREIEIIRLLLEGKSNVDIGKRLFISRHTVRNHVHHIFEKADVKSRGQLTFRIREALKNS